MLNRASYIFFFIILFFCFVPFAFAQEKINNFDTNITINKDGTIDIVETIKYDFGSEYRHGIYREIDIFKTNKENKKYLLTFKIDGVTNLEGKKYKYTQSEDRGRGKLILKIGDPDVYVSGEYDYKIAYKVKGALSYFSDHDELYWNLTGNDWKVPIISSSTIINYPEEIPANSIGGKCFTGLYGSSASDCQINILRKTINISTNNPLSINEGISSVISFPKNYFAVLEPKLYTPFWQTLFGKFLSLVFKSIFFVGIFFWYVFYPIYIVYKWFRYGRDPSSTIGKVRAWYDAPKTLKRRVLTPAETGTLIDERVDLKDISSAIVDLARRGFLKIEERKKKDFYFIKRKEYKNSNLLQFEKELLDGIFETEEEVRLKDQKLYTTIVSVKEKLYSQLVDDKFFPKSPQKIRNFYVFIMIMGLVTLNIPLALISGIFGRIMPRKTLDGVNASNIANSLKNFLSSQDRQLEFQAKNQMFFEKLLPYAVAFGVEKVWANRFKDINMTQPDWYSGQSSTFSSTYLVYGLNSSFRNVASAVTPTTSSSGFSSGFSSGGGFSGGGGGGGGGGSW